MMRIAGLTNRAMKSRCTQTMGAKGASATTRISGASSERLEFWHACKGTTVADMCMWYHWHTLKELQRLLPMVLTIPMSERREQTLHWAVYQQMKKPPAGFEEVVRRHFKSRRVHVQVNFFH